MSEPFYTIAVTAERLKLHPKTVLRMIREGRLRATRIGKSYRILRSDLEAFVGMAADVPPRAPAEQVTCIVELDPLGAEAAGRLMDFLHAAAITASEQRNPVRLSSGYDPERENLKIIVIGALLEAAKLLQLAKARLENS
jgi:excisionase family DNA binding protein